VLHECAGECHWSQKFLVLHGDLQNKNVRCWFAPQDVQGGRMLHEQIDEVIRVHEKMLLTLSAESMHSVTANG